MPRPCGASPWVTLKLVCVKNQRSISFGRSSQATHAHLPDYFCTLLLLLRSPWSNSYDPPLEDGALPSERLRKLEVDANQAFDQYREMYFEGGVSSVYLWDLDHGFAGVVLIKKGGDGSRKIMGSWDSIHVVEVQVRGPPRLAHSGTATGTRPGPARLPHPRKRSLVCRLTTS